MFNDLKTAYLDEPLPSEHVKTREGTGSQQLSYIASHHAINEANNVFGYGNWGTEILFLKEVYRKEYKKKEKDMISISYSCQLKLIVSVDGSQMSHEDVGFGNGVAGNTPYGANSCIELATKEAVTDALKRNLRYYGNKFGLSLYDKDNKNLSTIEDIELSRQVTDEELKKLRSLYKEREINDEWVLVALKSESYPEHTLEKMRYDWFLLAMSLVEKYKFEEIERCRYDEDIKKLLDMIDQSVNMNMLKGIFAEVWNKTTKYKDKENQQLAQKKYNEMKIKLGESK